MNPYPTDAIGRRLRDLKKDIEANMADANQALENNDLILLDLRLKCAMSVTSRYLELKIWQDVFGKPTNQTEKES